MVEYSIASRGTGFFATMAMASDFPPHEKKLTATLIVSHIHNTIQGFPKYLNNIFRKLQSFVLKCDMDHRQDFEENLFDWVFFFALFIRTSCGQSGSYSSGWISVGSNGN
jgi:hypothetical protein